MLGNIALAGREGLEPRPLFTERRLLRRPCSRSGGALSDACDEVHRINGLFEKVRRATVKRPDRERNGAVGGQKEDRNARATADELRLNLEPVHAGHLHVEDDASGTTEALGFEK